MGTQEIKKIIQRSLENHLVQAIIRVNFATVTAFRFMATNDSYSNFLFHTVLQLSAQQVEVK